MNAKQIEADIVLFVGDSHESVATAFLHNDDALLIDTLASRADAECMRDYLNEMRKTVRTIVATHYMSDHMAGLKLYPDAQIIAQRYFHHTFQSQRYLSAQDLSDFVEPTLIFGDTLSIKWGRHVLQLFHNPGKTLCSTNIDVPSCDTVFTADNIVGNIVYLSSSSPNLIGEAIERLQLLQRGRVIAGHMGIFDGAVLGNDKHYLRRLGEQRIEIYSPRPHHAEYQDVASITIESCLAPNVVASEFERKWHARNLAVLQEQDAFRLAAVRETASHTFSALFG